MAKVLIDRYSAICTLRALESDHSDPEVMSRFDPAFWSVLQNLILCDELFLARTPDYWGLHSLKDKMPEVVRFLGEIEVTSKTQGDGWVACRPSNKGCLMNHDGLPKPSQNLNGFSVGKK